MKKVYTIEITKVNSHKTRFWYNNKEGQQFDAELGVRENGSAAFRVNPVMWVLPEHCDVVSEKLVKDYSK